MAKAENQQQDQSGDEHLSVKALEIAIGKQVIKAHLPANTTIGSPNTPVQVLLEKEKLFEVSA